jgi:hypothetical protein
MVDTWVDTWVDMLVDMWVVYSAVLTAELKVDGLAAKKADKMDWKTADFLVFSKAKMKVDKKAAL